MKNLSRLIKQIYIDPGSTLISILSFLAGIFAINFIYDGIILIFNEDWLAGNHWIYFVIGLGFFFIALCLLVLQQILTRSSRIQMISDVPAHKGLIVLASVGAGISSARNAIDYHLNQNGTGQPLQFVEILAGPGSGITSSRSQSEEIEHDYELREVNVHIIDIEDGDDPSQSYQQTIQAIDHLTKIHKLKKSEIIADYTGGTKSMTAGLFMACYNQGCEIQFMKPSKMTEDGRADYREPSQPKRVEFSIGNPITAAPKQAPE